MTSPTHQFRQLHHQPTALLLANVWNTQSALIFQESGYQAVGTSSAAVAKSLGYEDGQNIPFEEYLFIVRAIRRICSLPLTVDVEAGFAESDEAIVDNLAKLHQVGVVGVNIEDSRLENGSRILEDAAIFSEKITQISHLLKERGIDLFINLRTDTYLLNVPDKFAQTLQRIDLYQQAGIDGIFVPCLNDPGDIEAICSHARVPINVMCMPDLPDFDTLEKAGVKRISMGNFLYEKLYQDLRTKAGQISDEKTFNSIF
ncbi:MAG: isocitrate lyase/phosphoenolpyruvate mutase family protein [Cytophagales bacterium]|nr:MAG: isocitrate lyase/phosphoenolpyruvate mutase family protein [Cytophagales bacterium]